MKLQSVQMVFLRKCVEQQGHGCVWEECHESDTVTKKLNVRQRILVIQNKSRLQVHT